VIVGRLDRACGVLLGVKRRSGSRDAGGIGSIWVKLAIGRQLLAQGVHGSKGVGIETAIFLHAIAGSLPLQLAGEGRFVRNDESLPCSQHRNLQE
jgi:hypothetical protein